MARKGKKNPAADAASVTPLAAPLAAPTPKIPSPEEFLAAGHISGDPEFVHHSEAKEVASRSAKGGYAWYRSPATVELLVESRKILLKSAKAQGWPVAQVKRVHAYFNTTEEAIYLVAAEEDDLEAHRMSGWSRKATINLYELMRSHAQDLEQGKSILCQAHYNPGSRVGPALVVKLLNPLQTSWEKSEAPKQKKEPSATAQNLDHADDQDEEA